MQAATRTGLVIRVFGSFKISLNGVPVSSRTNKDFKTLAYLILKHGKAVNRTDLASLGWRVGRQGTNLEREEKSRYLSRTISALKEALDSEAWRISKPTAQSIQFDANGLDLDLLGWETGLSSDLPALEQAAMPFRNSILLEGWDDPWVKIARGQMQSDYLHALKALANRAQDHRDWDTAIRCFERISEVDPWYSDTASSWLKLLFDRHRFTAMRALYDSLLVRASLQKQALPSELQTQYRELSEAVERFQDSPANGHLPTPLSEFVPRMADVSAIRATVGSSRLTTLIGSGGIGKTRLAIATTADIRDQFYDRAWFVDLSDLPATRTETTEQIDSDSLWKWVAQVLRIKEQPGIDCAHTVCESLRAKEMLLLLDNCEHLLTASAHFVERLLSVCPRVKVIATSREPLGLTGEALWRVPGLEVPPPSARYNPVEVERFSAIRLLTARASLPQTPLRLNDQNVTPSIEICRVLDGIPLAIELAAAQIQRHGWSIETVAASLERSLHFLTAGSRTAPTRQQTLRASISWSYDLLSPIERCLFERLGLFVGGFTENAAHRICGTEPLLPDLVSELLSALSGKSLVEVRQTAIGVRFHLLQTIRHFALERLEERDASETAKEGDGISERQRMHRSHCEYYVGLAEEAEEHWRGAEQAEWLDILEREHGNVRVALAWATGEDGDIGLAVRMGSALGRFWFARTYHTEGLRWLRRILPLSHQQPLAMRLKLMQAAGNLAYALGDTASASEYYEDCLRLGSSTPYPQARAATLLNLANIQIGSEKYAEAESALTESLTLFELQNDTRGMSMALSNLAILACQSRQEYVSARDYQLRSLAMFRESGAQHTIAQECCNLAYTLLKLNDVSAALPCMRESVQLAVEIDSPKILAHSLSIYRLLAIIREDFKRASVLLAAEECLREEIQSPVPDMAIRDYRNDEETLRLHLTDVERQDCAREAKAMSRIQIVSYLDELHV